MIPTPFDPRLIARVAPAVAEAAMASGVATRPLKDLKAYRESLTRFVYRSGLVMQPVFAGATGSGKRIAYAEGEDERVISAAQTIVDEKLARPVLIGHRPSIENRIRELGLRLEAGRDVDILDPAEDRLTGELADDYYALRSRRGLSRAEALAGMRRNNTLFGACLLRRGEVDGLLCGTAGTYAEHLKPIAEVVGLRDGAAGFAAMHLLMLSQQNVFVCDTYINVDPDARQIAEMTLLAVEGVRRFGVQPRVALLSHSSFGSSDAPSARKMREALAIIQIADPKLEIDGEMHADAALSPFMRPPQLALQEVGSTVSLHESFTP